MLKSLKSKISLIYICLVFLIAIVGSASVLNLYSLSKAIDGLMIRNYKSINAIAYMLEAFERQDSAALIYINVDRQKGIELFTKNSNEFVKWYIVEFNNITETGEKDLLADMNNHYTKYTLLFSELQEIRNQEGLEKSAVFYDSVMMPEFINIKNDLRQLTHLNETAMFNAKERATNSTHNSMYIILMLSALAVIGGFVLSRFFTNRFLRPLDTLTEGIKSVKAGKWNHEISIVSKDEIAELSLEFNSMTKRLRLYEQSAVGKLLEEKNKSLAIVKSIPDPLLVLDTSYRILLINDACEAFFEIEEEKVIRKHFLEVIRNGELFDRISSTFAEGEEHEEKVILIQQKEDYYFNIIVTMVKDVEAKAVALIVLLQNVTQLKQLEKTRTDFIATISHEFKTPLTSIMMGTSMVLDESMGILNRDQRDILYTIREDGERLTTLVTELLELSRIESGKSVVHIKACSLGTIVSNSIKQFTLQAEHNNVKIHNRVNEGMPDVAADDEKITWVVNNLISNALKYSDGGDEIQISAFVKGEKAFVSVKDTGAGIPEEFQKKIFDKYVQVKGQDLEVRGTGLGLAVVKEIIRIHGGEIWCESKVDAGSTFTFTLPLSSQEGNE